METENIMNLKNLIIKLQKCTIPNDIPDEDIVLVCKFLQEALKLLEQNYQ